ncbi:MAG: GntR family transcriptional regulator [Proteobacteria bacterium]|nr:MAG: GntR family transcriptional regulator [Pseudomonadota bacterium]
MKFKAPESLSEQIAQHLGKKIIQGQLKPGQRIQELTVARELNVSRGSVREALLILERRHLIHIAPRRGAIVEELSPHLVVSLYDMYIHLLVMLTVKTALIRTPRQLETLMKHVRKMNQLSRGELTDLDQLMDDGFDLLDGCLEIVNNPYLEETLENIKPALSRTCFVVLSREKNIANHTVQFYNDLLTSIKEQDTVKTTRIVKSYGEHQKRSVLAILEELADAATLIG